MEEGQGIQQDCDSLRYEEKSLSYEEAKIAQA